MSFIQFEKQDGIAKITLNRPAALNAFDRHMYADFSRALQSAHEHEDVRAVLLVGAGKDFSAGNDIASFSTPSDRDLDQLSERTQTPSTDVVHRLAELEKPLVGCVQGRAIGFGATMLLHCDFIIAAPSAVLIYPFVDIGIIPEAGASILMEQRLGRIAARRILMLGDPVEAEEAARLGLVSEIAPEAESLRRATDLAATLAAKPESAMQATKRLMNRDNESLDSRITAEFVELADRLRCPETQTIMHALKKQIA